MFVGNLDETSKIALRFVSNLARWEDHFLQLLIFKTV